MTKPKASTIESFNYSVVSRHDQELSQIFFTSPICEVYQYDSDAGSWNKKDCKGTLFLYSRITHDEYPYAALVLNRQSNDDFKMGITPWATSDKSHLHKMAVELNDNLLVIHASPEEIYGLWLFSEEDRKSCLSLIEWCLSKGSNS